MKTGQTLVFYVSRIVPDFAGTYFDPKTTPECIFRPKDFDNKEVWKATITEEVKNQLIYEIKIQSFLDHPNIVKLYAFFSDQEHIYLVMELCTSGHLFDLLRSIKTLPESTTKIIVKQLCQGMDYLHHHEIIHRDLKLENILYHFVHVFSFRE